MSRACSCDTTAALPADAAAPSPPRVCSISRRIALTASRILSAGEKPAASTWLGLGLRLGLGLGAGLGLGLGLG